MGLKIINKRVRCYSSDSSVSSPEQDRKIKKFILQRAPPASIRQKSCVVATPSHKPDSFPTTSTPCLKAAPPFQLSQTILSPVSKDISDLGFKKPKVRNAPVAREETFDNLLTSPSRRNTSSKLVVKRRDKPLPRDNIEADIERTRQYGGKKGPNNILFTEDCQELTINSPTKKQQAQDRAGADHKVSISETATKPAEYVKEKVVAERLCHSKNSEELKNSKIDAKNKSQSEVPPTFIIETTEEIDENTIKQKRSSTPDTRERKRRSSFSQGGKENHEDVQTGSPIFNGRRTRSRNEPEGRDIVVGRVLSCEQNSVISTSEIRHCDDSVSLRSGVKFNEGTKENDGSLGSNEVQTNRLSETIKTASFQRRQLNLPGRCSSLLQESEKSQDETKSVSGDIPGVESSETVEVVQTVKTEENSDATEEKRKSVSEEDRFLLRETDIKTEEQIVPILCPVSTKEQAVVVEEDNSVQVVENQEEEKPVSMRRTRRSLGMLKESLNTEEDNSVSVVENQEEDKPVSMRQTRRSLRMLKESLNTGEDNSVPVVENQEEEKPVSMRRTRRSRGMLKESLNTTSDEVSTGKSLAGDELTQNEFLQQLDMSPQKTHTVPDSLSHDTEKNDAVDHSKENVVMKNSEDPKMTVVRNSTDSSTAGTSKNSGFNRSAFQPHNVGRGKSKDNNVERQVSLSTEQTEYADNTSGRKDEAQLKRGNRMTLLGGYRKKLKIAAGLPHNTSDENRNEDNGKEVKDAESTGANEKAITTGAKKKMSKTKERKLILKKTSVASDCLNFSVSERPKRERRCPGDYWISVPRLTVRTKEGDGCGQNVEKKSNNPIVQKSVDVGSTSNRLTTDRTSQGGGGGRSEKKGKKPSIVRKSVDVDSTCNQLTNGRTSQGEATVRKSVDVGSTSNRLTTDRTSQGGGGGRSEKKRKYPTIVRKSVKRRLLSKAAVRESLVLNQPNPYCALVDVDSTCSQLTNGRTSQVPICHANDVTLRNKNFGLTSENPKVRIGSTVSWRSLSGNLIEMDSGAVSGPQVDVLRHQVYIVMEGTVVLEIHNERSHHTLDAGDSAVVPAGSKYTLRNGGSSNARFNVLTFLETL